MGTVTRILLESLFDRNSFLKNATVPRSVRDTMLTRARRLMASTGWQPWSGMLGLLDELANNFCTLRIMGSGTLTLVGVSASRGVGAVIGQYSPIDHLAAVLIVHEAGGAVLDEDGNVNLFPESGGILCATQAASRPLYNIWKKAIS